MTFRNENSKVGLGDDVDAPLEVARCLNEITNNNWGDLEDEKKKEFASNKGQFFDPFAVESMTVDRIRERGGYDELSEWFAAIKQYVV